MALARSFCAAPHSNAASISTGSVSIGTASADRAVVLAVSSRHAATNLQIGGIAASAIGTAFTEGTTTVYHASFWRLDTAGTALENATTAAITGTLAASGTYCVGIYAITGDTDGMTLFDSDSNGGNGANQTAMALTTVDVEAGGVVISAAIVGDDTYVSTLTGVTKDYEGVAGGYGREHFGGSAESVSGATPFNMGVNTNFSGLTCIHAAIALSPGAGGGGIIRPVALYHHRHHNKAA